MFEILLFAAFGIALGALAGIVPGLHVNTLALLMMALMPLFEPLLLAVAVITMSISTTFFDFIPSTLLGAPDPETALSVLPGHRMLMAGRGLDAIYMTMLGGLAASVIAAASLPATLLVIPWLYSAVQGYMGWLLVVVALFCVLSERKAREVLWSAASMLLSGALGFIALGSTAFAEPLFPMFTGLFGVSSLLLSLKERTVMPKQSMEVRPPDRRTVLSGVLKGLFSGSLVGTLPAVGASQAALVSEHISRRGGDKEYLVSMGAISTIVAMFSLVSLYTISKARSGTAVVVGKLLPEFGQADFLIMVACILLAAGVSALLLMKTARWFARAISGVSYPALTRTVLTFLIVLVFIMAGPMGLLLMAVGAAIGLVAPLGGARRSSAMGCLLLPLAAFYLGI